MNGIRRANLRNHTDDKGNKKTRLHALQSVRTATTVRVRGGKVLVTDGPFAEEQLLGFVLIEAKDHYEAVEVASRIPLARLGSIEVRSIMNLTRTGQS